MIIFWKMVNIKHYKFVIIFCWKILWFSIKDEMGPAPVCWGCLTHNGHNWLLRANKMLRDSKDTINSHPTAADSWFTLKIKIYVIWILVNTEHLSAELFYWTFSTFYFFSLLSVENTLAGYNIFWIYAKKNLVISKWWQLSWYSIAIRKIPMKIFLKSQDRESYLSENILDWNFQGWFGQLKNVLSENSPSEN